VRSAHLGVHAAPRSRLHRQSVADHRRLHVFERTDLRAIVRHYGELRPALPTRFLTTTRRSTMVGVDLRGCAARSVRRAPRTQCLTQRT
jgi:hypothetical protein